jgi:hypothetical protein
MRATTRRRLDALQAARARLTASARQSPTSVDLHDLTNDQLAAIIGIDPDDLTSMTDAQLKDIIDGTAELEVTL